LLSEDQTRLLSTTVSPGRAWSGFENFMAAMIHWPPGKSQNCAQQAHPGASSSVMAGAGSVTFGGSNAPTQPAE